MSKVENYPWKLTENLNRSLESLENLTMAIVKILNDGLGDERNVIRVSDDNAQILMDAISGSEMVLEENGIDTNSDYVDLEGRE